MISSRLYKQFVSGLFCIVFCFANNLFAQIKVGNNPGSLNPNAALEIESTDKGLLLPRLALTSTTSPAPLSAFVPGMFVYDTATVNDVLPGIYYSDGTKWIKVNSQTTSGFWKLDGNNGTDSTHHFLGTTDSQPLRVNTNNAERMRITENGRVGIGTTTPAATLHVKGQVIIDSLTAGDMSTDQMIVANPADGKLKLVPSSHFVMDAEKRVEVVATSGQTIFTTPSPITDVNKILLYRNGILISFIKKDANSIISEMPCLPGDEIRIFQLN